MGISSAVLRELMLAGIEGEALLAAVERIEQADQPVRTPRQARNHRYYENHRRLNKRLNPSERRLKASEASYSDAIKTPSLEKKVSPTPPSKKLNPPPNDSLTAIKGGTSAFEQFWSAYPKRKGANPKHPASLRFEAALKAGTDPEVIIDGAKRYGTAEGELGHLEGPYVKQAVAWLNQRCWEDYPAIEIKPINGTPQPPDPSMPSHEELLRIYGNQGKPTDGENPEFADEGIFQRGIGVDRAGEIPGDYQPRHAAVAGVEELPAQSNGRYTGGHANGRKVQAGNNDHADGMATLVRSGGASRSGATGASLRPNGRIAPANGTHAPVSSGMGQSAASGREDDRQFLPPDSVVH